MTLVKTSKIGATRATTDKAAIPKRVAASPKPAVRRVQTGGGKGKIAERLAAAIEELASGLTEASAAAEELGRSMEQIAGGAEEAAGGSQEQLAAIKNVVSHLGLARSQAEDSRLRTEAVQTVLTDTIGQVMTSVRAIERNAARQEASVATITELERRARDIGDISRTVGSISDQTNLLALNAAIEAARAGDHGRGFAVVAEEVRSLAETSEKRAKTVQDLSETIQADVLGVAESVKLAAATATAEAATGAQVSAMLEGIRRDMAGIAEASQKTVMAAVEAETAASQAQRGSEDVAVAAEQQSAAAMEAQTAIQQQQQSMSQGLIAAQALSSMSDRLEAQAAAAADADQVAAMAEELSAAIQELSAAATQIMAAVEQIHRGSQQQAAATQETSAALGQIQATAALAQDNAVQAKQQVEGMARTLLESRRSIERLAQGVSRSLEGTRASLAIILRLESVSRNIEKIIDGIGLVAVQTTMLAVSGSVEAARSGTFGRGFALVSNDIRNLARGAAESVETVKDTVRGILDQIGALRRDLEQTITTVEFEIESNRAIFAVLDKVDAEVAALKSANRIIEEGSEAIQSAVSQAADGARQIAAAAEEASGASRQASIATSQQAQGAEDLAAAIEEIALLADALKEPNG